MIPRTTAGPSFGRHHLLIVLLGLVTTPASAHPGGHGVAQESQPKLEADPCALHPRLERAQAWRADGAFDHARAELDVAARCHPDEPEVSLERGRLELASGNPAAAIPLLTRFLEAEGPEPSVLLVRSRAHEGVGDLRGAVADLKQAVDRMHQPRPEHYLRLARGLAALNRPREALTVAKRGIADVGEVSSLTRLVATLETR